MAGLAGAGVLGASYAGGSYMAANAAGVDQELLKDTLTPSVLESAAFGFLAAGKASGFGHRKGLQSGGLVGYSTFFSGYDPEMHGAARKYSLGRVGGAAVSAAGHALEKIPGLAGSRYIESMKSFHRLGLWAFNYTDGKGFDTPTGQPSAMPGGAKFSAIDPDSSHGRSLLKETGQYDDSVIMTRANKKASSFKNTIAQRSAWQSTVKDLFRKGREQRNFTFSPMSRGKGANTALETLSNAVGNRPNNPIVGGAPNKGGRMVSYIASWFGGTGATADGSEMKLAYDKLSDGTTIARAGRGAKHGANIIKGALGRTVGMGFQAAAAYEVAKYAAKGIGYAVGKGYESMVESTERIRRKTGSDQMMSGGYFNRAATSERQRAVQTMNTRTLHPRYQMMGNEAYWMHN